MIIPVKKPKARSIFLLFREILTQYMFSRESPHFIFQEKDASIVNHLGIIGNTRVK